MIGADLSHFRITAKLGEGGMGTVYQAEDRRLGRQVAIKVLPDDLVEDSQRLERFEREARLLASVRHPSIATLYDVGEAVPSGPDAGEEAQRPVRFLVMELVAGESLAQRMERGPLRIDEALRIAVEVAQALEAVYEHNIVHRDLKPANVKLDADDRVKLLDFGLGKELAATAPRGQAVHDQAETATYPTTAPGVVLGTPAYMSPEQVKGGPVDARTDLWALGIILWEMLTGRRLFHRESVAETLAAVLDAEVDFELLPTGTPAAARQLLRWLLVREADHRLRHPGDAWLLLEAARREGIDLAAPGGALAEEPPRAALETFRLSIELCRELDRDSLVPEMIGDDLQFLDNRRDSNVLVIYIPAMGNDHEQFREVIERSRHRSLSVSPYGWAESAERRPPLPLRDHLRILAHFVNEAVRRIEPSCTVIAGFSSGADIALRLPSQAGIELASTDAVLALGPNLSLATCFFTARLAAIDSESTEQMLETLREIEASAQTLEEWLLLSPFLHQVAKRFHSHIPALRSAARDIVAPFGEEGPSPFAAWYRALRERGIAVRALFCGASFDLEGLAALRLEHLDSDILGPAFAEADLVELRDRNHMQLLDCDLVEEQLDELLRQAAPEAARRDS